MAYVISVQKHLDIFIIIQCVFVIIRIKTISSYETTFDELCRFKGSCINCKEGGCDDLCQFYDNACCENMSLKNTMLQKWQFECVRKFPEMYDLNLDCRGSSDGVYGVFIVNKCSQSWTDEDIKNKCEGNLNNEIFERVPVSDSYLEKVTYKNIYCAFCNRLNLERIRFWKFDLMCATDGDEKIFNDCFIRLVNRPHRMCAVNVIENCPDNDSTNVTLREKCEIGISQNVYVWKHVNVFDVYKNQFCAQCNLVTKTLQCWAFQAFTCWPQDLPPYTYVHAMISLVLYGKIEANSMKIFNHSACGDGVLYNPLDKSCLNVTCLPLLNTCISGKCRLVEITHTSFRTLNDTSIFVFDLENIIEKERYFMRDNSTFVCLNDNQYLELMKRQISTQSTRSTDTVKLKSTFTTVSSARKTTSSWTIYLFVKILAHSSFYET